MIKVLLVDDEVLALEYLRGLIDWETYGFSIAGCATSARKALALCDELQPEAVISDIKMPGMDGLELAERLQRKSPDTVVILVSAYQDFEYAKKGIRYGVMDYLLKNELNEESLIPAMERIGKRIEEKRKSSQMNQRYFMDQMLRYSAENYGEYEEKLGKRLAMVMVHRYEEMLYGSFCEQKLAASGEWLEYARGVSEEWLKYVSDVFIADNTAVFLYRIEGAPGQGEIAAGMRSLTEHMLWLQRQGQVSDVVALYSEEISCSQVNPTFRRMSGKIRNGMLWGDGTAKGLTDTEGESQESLSIDEVLKALRGLPESVPDVAQYLDDAFGRCRMPGLRIEDIKIYISGLERVLTQLEQEWEIQIRDRDNLRLSGFAQIRCYYIDCFARLQGRLREYRQRGYSPVIWKTMHYLESHYREEISLEELGGQMRMNGVYLGQLFKKETGMTCLKYQTNCRLKKAEQLLLAGKYNIGEVAEMVGYQTSQYFSRTFQKNVGVSPQEYRKRAADGGGQ